LWLASFETAAATNAATHGFIQYTRAKGTNQLVVLNPGTYFDPSYLTNYDVNVKAIIMENSVNSWQPSLVSGSACASNGNG